MSTEWSDGIANKACLRCRKHKRKCDRELPKCSLCTRLRQICKYEVTPSYPSPVASLDSSQAIQGSPDHIKEAVIQRLAHFQPSDVATIYFRTIEPWFPILAEDRLLCNGLPSTWDGANLDFTVLSFSIVLFGTVPGSNPDDLRTLYLCAKSWTALIEASGIISVDIIDSRLLITLFEVAHGFYPAAYISMGSTVRAAEALAVCKETGSALSGPTDEEVTVERMMNWCGIAILDRYIAIENGKWPPVTRGRTCTHLPPSISFTDSAAASPLFREFVRLFEASNLVDKVHTALHEPTSQHSFNMEEVMLIVKTLNSLESVLNQDIPEPSKIYSSGLSICLTGLLLAFENGSKAYIDNEDTSQCQKLASVSMDGLIEVICKMIAPFTLGKETLNVETLPPFVTYLLYKTADVVTERVRMGDSSVSSLGNLRSLRNILKLISRRWLCAERYLDILDEDTTPRILKALENVRP